MSRTATGQIKLTAKGTSVVALNDGTLAKSAVGGLIVSHKFTSGVETNQVNRGWWSRNNLLSSGNSVEIDIFDFVGLDIGAGPENDAVGQAMSPIEEVAGLILVSESTSSGDLEVSTNAVQFDHFPIMTVANGGAIKPGGFYGITSPVNGADIVDSSSHKVELTANGGDVIWSLYLLGRNDDEASSSSSSSQSSSSQSSSSSSSSSMTSDLSSSSDSSVSSSESSTSS